MLDEFVFDLDPVEIPVTVGGVHYVLREASEATAAKWRTASAKGAALGEDGRIAKLPDNPGALQALLVGDCLYRVDDGGTSPRPVGKAEVDKWPARIVTPLFDKAKRISGLVEDTLADLKRQLTDLTERIAEMEEQGEDPTSG